ncbi:MAG TPA: hypothetical protein ENH62_03760 [Marinobacter sp.]|uniref:Uncharacterized protein n=1 Tax=marine sediment metagenome TaxID=412755 RepID=A0A0F9L391_9ZZZZ|nr:hypothetical protein [Marinobacter sp.]
MASKYSKEDMRQRFWELTAEKEVLVAEVAPIRARHDAIRAKMAPLQAELIEVKAELIAVERPRLAELDNERATLARALSNKVGDRPGIRPRRK